MKLSITIIGFILIISACQSDSSMSVDVEEVPEGYLLADADLPDYEQNLDHAALIKTESEEFYHKGMITYRTVCYNCHGNEEQPGSMPNSTKFWKDEFKNGADPYAMYQTLTKGFGLMAPQVRLSPKEKYDVINFIREEYMQEQNPSQYIEVDSAYLASLPRGNTLGPDPTKYQPWAEMDYGDFFIHTYDFADSNDPPRQRNQRGSPIPNEDLRDRNFAYKGIAIRLNKGKGGVAAGNAFALFDHDLLRFTGFWTGDGFIDYRSILLNDEHNIYPRTVGTKQLENPITPGWENPVTKDFIDPRFVAVDGRPFGPLPKQWAHYKGVYYHGQKVIIKYTVGEATVHELYALERAGDIPVISRTLNISKSSVPLTMRILPDQYAVAVMGGKKAIENGFHVLKVPANTVLQAKILMAAKDSKALELLSRKLPEAEDLSKYTKGGPSHYVDQVLTSPIIKGEEKGAYAEDVFVLPQENPWKSRMRPSGIDFIKGGKEAIVTTIDGEVWRLEGILQEEGNVKWHRIATGLFQPLGVRYINDAIYVGCRDAIYVLRDLNLSLIHI